MSRLTADENFNNDIVRGLLRLRPNLDMVFTAESAPLAMDRDGKIRVGGTRVTLDTIVAAFENGATAEEIAYQYPSVQLADIYATITYYLRQPDEVNQYLDRREEEAQQVRRENEARFDPAGIRDRLLARQKAQS